MAGSEFDLVELNSNANFQPNRAESVIIHLRFNIYFIPSFVFCRWVWVGVVIYLNGVVRVISFEGEEQGGI